MNTRWATLLVTLLLQPLDLAGQARAPHGNADSAMEAGRAILQRAPTNGRDFDRARELFRQAHQLEPEWADPLLGIGLAESGKGDWLAAEPLNLGTRVGHGAYRSAIRALIAATVKDPGLTAAIVEMDRVALSLRDTAVDHLVLQAVRAAVTSGNDHPSALLILGRRERSAGQGDASIANLERYLSKGTDSSLGRYELARTLLSSNREEGASLYFSAAITADSATSAEVRSDLIPIAERDELARFDSTSGARREQFLRQFWEDRARRDLRSTSERLREHYRRLRFARQHFVLSNNRRYYGRRDLYRAPRSETLDDRGVVYVRHGEPDQRLRPLLFGLLPNETWLYRRADGDLLLHFSAGGERFEGGDLTDYRLVPSVFALRGDRTPKEMLIASRFEVSDLYQKIMAWGPLGARRAMEAERDWGESSASIGTTTDGFALLFESALKAGTDLVTIGRRGTSPLLHVIYALPPELGPGTPVRFRIAIFDSLGSVEAWQDSSAISEPMGPGGSGGRFEITVPPGTWTYRYALEAGRAGMVAPRGSVEVPDLLDPRLSISGIALGQSRGNLRWLVGPADTAMVNPNHEVPRDSELQLYYELYGLSPFASYSASVTVYDRRGSRLGRSRLRFTFQEEAQGEISRVRRSVRLAGLPPREYWLEVAVHDGQGRQVVTRKGFSVISVTH